MNRHSLASCEQIGKDLINNERQKMASHHWNWRGSGMGGEGGAGVGIDGTGASTTIGKKWCCMGSGSFTVGAASA